MDFQIDLRGIVQILCHHLYSSPTVYLWELIQNARDSIRARTLMDPDAPRSVGIVVDEASGELTVTDTGISLAAEEKRTSQRVTLVSRQPSAVSRQPSAVSRQPSPRTVPGASDARAAAQWCQEESGFTPEIQFPLDVPPAGVRGLAFVAPDRGRGGSRRARRGRHVGGNGRR